MHGQAAAGWVFKRGVFKAPYKVHGWPVLVAIDSKLNARKHVKLKPNVDELEATRWLWQLLDRIDPPQPVLRLVTPSRMPVPAQVARPPEDQITYALRRARAAAKRWPSVRD